MKILGPGRDHNALTGQDRRQKVSQRLPCARSGDDPEPLAAPGELADVRPMLFLEHGVEMKTEGELDRLAGGARRRDDENLSGRRLGGEKGVVVGWEIPVSYLSRH